MYSKTDISNSRQNNSIRFVSIILCAVLFVVLGMAAVAPNSVTQMLRPLFILACLLSLLKGVRLYRANSTKWAILSSIYFTIILVFNTITTSALITYISMVLFLAFFILAGSYTWTKREIMLILFVVLLSCDFQAVVLNIFNPRLLYSTGNQHVSFLGTTTNRNPCAFALVPGALSGLIIFKYCKKSNCLRLFGFFSCLLCFYTVFAIGCRSAFISVAVGAFLMLWQAEREKATKIDRLQGEMKIIIFVVLLVLIMTLVVSDTYSERLFDYSDSSGRKEIWKKAWTLIDAKPIFGGGYDYWSEADYDIGTHNSLILLLLYSGYVGGTLITVMLFSVFVDCVRSHNLIPIAFFTETVCHTMTETSMDYYTFIPMVLTLIILKYIQSHKGGIYEIFS